jgi:hypothetical protein
MNITSPKIMILSIIAIIILMFYSSSCSAISNSASKSTPTLTKSSTSTITLTPSITPTISYLEWPVVFSDSFNEDNKSWTTGEINDEYTKGTISIMGGKYYIKLTAKKACYWHASPKMDGKINTYVTVKVDRLNGTKNTDYGLLLRNYYYFNINMDYQRYSFQVLLSGNWNILTLWTTSYLIRPYEPNEISIKAEGINYIEYINSEEVDDAQDIPLVRGTAGIGITLYKAGDWIEITFDNFEVRAPSD